MMMMALLLLMLVPPFVRRRSGDSIPLGQAPDSLDPLAAHSREEEDGVRGAESAPDDRDEEEKK
jgi:hypothetical protein